MKINKVKSQFEATWVINGKWVTETIFYYGDHSNFDKNDWRFKEVEGKRKELKFIKLINP